MKGEKLKVKGEMFDAEISVRLNQGAFHVSLSTLFEVQIFAGGFDLGERIPTRDADQLLALLALDGLLLLVGEGEALIVDLVEPGRNFHAAGEQHLDGPADELAVLSQAPEFGTDAGRSDGERKILGIAVELRLDGAAQLDAGVDGNRRIAVDQELDFIARRTIAAHYEHVGTCKPALGGGDDFFRVDHG